MEYRGLNENEFHGLICLNTLSPAGETVWEELEDVALLEELCHWRWTLRFKEIHATLNYPLCLLFVGQDMSSQFPYAMPLLSNHGL